MPFGPSVAVLVGLGALLSWSLTRLVRGYALKRLLDVPGERSLHQYPMPRGGGLAIVTVVLLAMVVLAGVGDSVWWVVAAASVGVALVGWVDDHGHVSSFIRAFIHLVAAAVCVGGFGIPDGGWNAAGLVAAVVFMLTVLGIAWLINLYNFMDGIDALAGCQAVTVGLMGGALLWSSGATDLAVFAWIIAAASLGFLVWNWPPAKIFMGDVGSGFLGFAFGVLALASDKAGAVPVLTWLVLLAIFVADATFTLLHRVIKGEQWYAAHRTHAYQRLVQLGWSHRRVTVSVLLINVGLLGPTAMLALSRPEWMLGIALGVYGAAGALWFWIQRRYARVQRLRGLVAN